jgi:hypothetical protein
MILLLALISPAQISQFATTTTPSMGSLVSASTTQASIDFAEYCGS